MTFRAANTKRLTDLLHNLPLVVADKVSRAAVVAAAEPIVEAAKAKAPVESGTLRDAIEAKARVYKESGVAVAVVGPRSDAVGEFEGETRIPANYAHLVEFGTVDDPAQPFLRPAFDEQAETATGIIADKLTDGIEREAAKLGGGS